MSRVVGLGLLLVVLPACRLPPEQAPLRPLPEGGEVFSYEEILIRARLQSSLALDAFYVDNWTDLAEAAMGLEQSARFLPKTSDPPAKFSDKLVAEAVLLRKEALRLADAAKTKDVSAANLALQRIFFKIHQLRPDPAAKPSEPAKNKKQ